MRYGTASVWAENFLAKIVGVETPKDLGTWMGFLSKLKLKFKESNKMDKVWSTPMAFSQGIMTVDKYSNQFLLIAANTNISDKEQVLYYQRGLDPKVMDKIYNKETLPKDTIQDWVNMACKVDGHMRAWSAQKVILANSTSFRSNFLNYFHLQPTLRYNSTNAPCRMSNQVVDIDINTSQKQNAAHQKWMHDGKPPSPC